MSVLLASFHTAPKEDHQPLAIFPEVNPVTRTKINPVLVNASSNAFRIR